MAAIKGDTITVTGPRGPVPVVIHFAWDDAARSNFFNAAGLSVVPFRTDHPFTRTSTPSHPCNKHHVTLITPP
ncbi:MAG: hypothetical protein JWP63_6694 [Candidatus Solibacter sp.]|nr:hypothetical protein [Candidatus Solibacter sp.]